MRLSPTTVREVPSAVQAQNTPKVPGHDAHNPHEELGRFRRAVKLADIVAACKCTSATAEAANETSQALFAKLARLDNPPSAACWELVVQLLRDREEAVRRMEAIS